MVYIQSAPLALSVSFLMSVAGTSAANAQSETTLSDPIQPTSTAVSATEEEDSSPNNRISFGPLGMLFGIGNLTYERAVSDRVSFELSPSVIYWGFSDDTLYGGSLGVGGSYYFTGSAPEGLRLTAGVSPGYVSVDSNDNDRSTAFLLSAKTMVGYNWVWDGGFSLGLSGGFQYVHINAEDFDGAIDGVLPAVDFNLGFVF